MYEYLLSTSGSYEARADREAEGRERERQREKRAGPAKERARRAPRALSVCLSHCLYIQMC